MRIEEIKKTAVIGAGMMGSQIAGILSQLGGYDVYLVDVNDAVLQKALETIEERLDRFLVSRGKMTVAEKRAVTARIRPSTSASEAVRDVDLVIEAVAENLALKKQVFSTVHGSAPQRAILASNTSLLNISEIAAATARPQQIIGIHFFNPVTVMPLVEVVTGSLTSQETTDCACALARKLGKDPVVCSDLSYGFVANRAYRAMLGEAVQMVWERVTSPADIDKALKLGYGLPKGPLELYDAIGGWAIRAAAEEDTIRELGSDKGKLHPLIKAMIRAGYTGGPGKKGIYDFWRDVLSR